MISRPPSFTNATPFAQLFGRKGLLLWIREFLDKTNMDGFYIEFGVFNGESIKEAFYALRNQVIKYIGFDSFSGLPKLSNKIDTAGANIMEQFVEGNYTSMGYDFVKTNILSTGMDEGNLLLVKGFFDETLTQEMQSSLLSSGNGKASVIHVDVDLYSSTLQALEFSHPFMQTGCWLLCDDYWCYRGGSSFGTQRAINEFLKNHPDIHFQEYCSYNGWAKAFIIDQIP